MAVTLVGNEPGLRESQRAGAVDSVIPLPWEGTSLGKAAIDAETRPGGRNQNRSHAVAARGVASREAVTQERLA